MHILSNCIQNEQICERRWITYRAEQEEPAAVFQKHGGGYFLGPSAIPSIS